MLQTGEGGVQYRHRHKAGGWVHLEARGTNQLDNPDIRGIVINVRDVTERMKADESMQQNEAKLRTFVANQPGVAFIIDKNGIFTLSEGLGLANLGLKPGQVVGSSVFDVYKDIPEIGEHIRQALSGSIRQFQVSVGKADFDVWLGPLINSETRITGHSRWRNRPRL
jgi:PAS domain-containing protein